jgi:hypothetical protein
MSRKYGPLMQGKCAQITKDLLSCIPAGTRPTTATSRSNRKLTVPPRRPLSLERQPSLVECPGERFHRCRTDPMPTSKLSLRHAREVFESLDSRCVERAAGGSGQLRKATVGVGLQLVPPVE